MSWQPFRLLLFICVSCVFLTAAGADNSRARFVKLDSEIQAIKEEILDINRDILLLEEMSLYFAEITGDILVLEAEARLKERGTYTVEMSNSSRKNYGAAP